jgi:hypothetical protein
MKRIIIDMAENGFIAFDNSGSSGTFVFNEEEQLFEYIRKLHDEYLDLTGVTISDEVMKRRLKENMQDKNA